jgi:hypothetical protein
VRSTRSAKRTGKRKWKNIPHERPLKSSRIRLAAAVTARLTGALFPHGIIRQILRSELYELRIRSLSAAITRVELDQRRQAWRFAEYVYVLLRLPRNKQVTVGPTQIRLSKLVKPIAHCSCYSSSWEPSLIHCLRRHHQALSLLAEIRTLCSVVGMDRQVINAYNKGVHASDLKLPTVYSQIVESLATKYEIVAHQSTNPGPNAD